MSDKIIHKMGRVHECELYQIKLIGTIKSFSRRKQEALGNKR